MNHRKRFVTVLAALVFLCGAGIAMAQSRGGGGGHSGGGWSGGGGGWSGGGGGWHGGGWQGGGWNGGWHGGNWSSGWHGSWNGGWGGCWNCWRWNGARWAWWGPSVNFWWGVPGGWWWPTGAWWWGAPAWPATAWGISSVDPGPVVFIQRDMGSPVESVVPPPAQAYYYCSDPAGYYPQVTNCNRPWTKVVPNSPPPTLQQ